MTTSDNPYSGSMVPKDREPGEVPFDPAGSVSEPGADTESAPSSSGANGTLADAKSAAKDAKQEAIGVASTATDAGARVAGTAKDEAAKVTAEAGRQAKDLLDQTRQEFASQAGEQQQRVAKGLRQLTAEMSSMADSAEQPGVASDLTRQAAQRVDAFASWLDQRAPGELLDEVTSFARQRPGAFLALAAGAGLLAGRLTRGLVADARDSSGDDGEVGDVARASNGDRDAGRHEASSARTSPAATTYPPFDPPEKANSYARQPGVLGLGDLP